MLRWNSLWLCSGRMLLLLTRPASGLLWMRHRNTQSPPPTAYIGQVLSVVTGGKAISYTIADAAGTLAPLGAAAVAVATDPEVNEMLTEVFGK